MRNMNLCGWDASFVHMLKSWDGVALWQRLQEAQWRQTEELAEVQVALADAEVSEGEGPFYRPGFAGLW